MNDNVINIKNLKNYIASLDNEQLNEMLNCRDNSTFDHAWNVLYLLVKNDYQRVDSENIFLSLSEISNHHEICSYIVDDLELIFNANRLDVSTKFLDYLKSEYAKSRVPYKWNGNL